MILICSEFVLRALTNTLIFTLLYIIFKSFRHLVKKLFIFLFLADISYFNYFWQDFIYFANFHTFCYFSYF